MKLKVTEQIQVQYEVDIATNFLINEDRDEVENYILNIQPPRDEWVETVFERDWEEANTDG